MRARRLIGCVEVVRLCAFLGLGLLFLALLHAVDLALFALDEGADVRVELLKLFDVVGVVLLVARPVVMLDCRLHHPLVKCGRVTYRVKLHEVREQADLLLVVVLADAVHLHFYLQVHHLAVKVCRQFARLVLQRALRGDACHAVTLFNGTALPDLVRRHAVVSSQIQTAVVRAGHHAGAPAIRIVGLARLLKTVAIRRLAVSASRKPCLSGLGHRPIRLEGLVFGRWLLFLLRLLGDEIVKARRGVGFGGLLWLVTAGAANDFFVEPSSQSAYHSRLCVSVLNEAQIKAIYLLST